MFPWGCDWSDVMVSTCWKQTFNPPPTSAVDVILFPLKTDWTLLSVLNNAVFCERLSLGVGDWFASALGFQICPQQLFDLETDVF